MYITILTSLLCYLSNKQHLLCWFFYLTQGKHFGVKINCKHIFKEGLRGYEETKRTRKGGKVEDKRVSCLILCSCCFPWKRETSFIFWIYIHTFWNNKTSLVKISMFFMFIKFLEPLLNFRVFGNGGEEMAIPLDKRTGSCNICILQRESNEAEVWN